MSLSRRSLLGAAGASPFIPFIPARAQGKPTIRIGVINDMSGPYRDVGGPGNRWAAELAIQDNGGSVLDRPVVILQADDQNKPDVASQISRAWIDGEDCFLAESRSEEEFSEVISEDADGFFVGAFFEVCAGFTFHCEAK